MKTCTYIHKQTNKQTIHYLPISIRDWDHHHPWPTLVSVLRYGNARVLQLGDVIAYHFDLAVDDGPASVVQIYLDEIADPYGSLGDYDQW